MTSLTDRLRETLSNRIVLLDGAMGTVIQYHKLDEQAYRTQRLADHGVDLKGNYDLLTLTQPAIIESIHRSFLDAGADIIETNTINSTAIAQADYELSELAYELRCDEAAVVTV